MFNLCPPWKSCGSPLSHPSRFDLDETIIDSLGTYTEVFNAGTRIFGLEPVTEERIAHFLEETKMALAIAGLRK